MVRSSDYGMGWYDAAGMGTLSQLRCSRMAGVDAGAGGAGAPQNLLNCDAGFWVVYLVVYAVAQQHWPNTSDAGAPSLHSGGETTDPAIPQVPQPTSLAEVHCVEDKRRGETPY